MKKAEKLTAIRHLDQLSQERIRAARVRRSINQEYGPTLRRLEQQEREVLFERNLEREFEQLVFGSGVSR